MLVTDFKFVLKTWIMLLYKYLCDSLTRLRAQTRDVASGRKVDYVNILRLKGNPNLIFLFKS